MSDREKVINDLQRQIEELEERLAIVLEGQPEKEQETQKFFVDEYGKITPIPVVVRCNDCCEKLKEKAAEVEIEGGILNWWFVCGECQMQISKGDKYCKQCGRELDWSGIYLKETGAERVPDDLRSEGAEREQEPGEP